LLFGGSAQPHAGQEQVPPFFSTLAHLTVSDMMISDVGCSRGLESSDSQPRLFIRKHEPGSERSPMQGRPFVLRQRRAAVAQPCYATDVIIAALLVNTQYRCLGAVGSQFNATELYRRKRDGVTWYGQTSVELFLADVVDTSTYRTLPTIQEVDTDWAAHPDQQSWL